MTNLDIIISNVNRLTTLLKDGNDEKLKLIKIKHAHELFFRNSLLFLPAVTLTTLSYDEVTQ